MTIELKCMLFLMIATTAWAALRGYFGIKTKKMNAEQMREASLIGKQRMKENHEKEYTDLIAAIYDHAKETGQTFYKHRGILPDYVVYKLRDKHFNVVMVPVGKCGETELEMQYISWDAPPERVIVPSNIATTPS